MSSDEKYKDVIKREMGKLTKPIKLKVFTSLKTNPDGSKVRECAECNQFMTLLRIYEQNSTEHRPNSIRRNS